MPHLFIRACHQADLRGGARVAGDSCVLRAGDCIALLSTENAPLFQLRSDGEQAAASAAAEPAQAASQPQSAAAPANGVAAPPAAANHAAAAVDVEPADAPAAAPAAELDEPALKR